MTFENRIKQYYPYLLVSALLLLLLFPWGYYDTTVYRYTFIYKKIILCFLGLSTILSIHVNKSLASVLVPCTLGVAAFVAAYFFDGNLEKHFILQFVYLEIVRQIFMLPSEMRARLNKINPYIVYLMVLKGFIWSTGNYIHGGYYSSNLYSFFLFLFCIPEIKQKRWYNVLLPGYFLIIAGSKSVYLGIAMVILYLSYEMISFLTSYSFMDKFFKRINIFYSFLGAILFSAVIAVSLNQGLLFPQVQQDLVRQRMRITKKNLKRRGLVPTTLEELKMDYESKQEALLTEHPVSPYKTTMVLRAFQYDAFFKNFGKVSILGNFRYILERAFGFNPHNAIIDVFARLGILYCLLMAFLYRKTLVQIKEPLLLMATLPALCLQPYGFSLGHGIVFLGLIAYMLKIETSEGQVN